MYSQTKVKPASRNNITLIRHLGFSRTKGAFASPKEYP